MMQLCRALTSDGVLARDRGGGRSCRNRHNSSGDCRDDDDDDDDAGAGAVRRGEG